MRMPIRTTIISACSVFALAFLLFSCRPKTDPISASAFLCRLAQDTILPSYPIFQGLSGQNYTDIAALREEPYIDGSKQPPPFVSGSLKNWVNPPYDKSWDVAVSMEQDNPYYGTMISFTWLSSQNDFLYQSGNPAFYAVDGSLALHYKFPKVDAIYLENPDYPDNGIVEMAVCYMWRSSAGDQWEVGITVSQLSEQAFLNGNIGSKQMFAINYIDDGPLSDHGDEWHPDICYDTDTGDIYLLYTNMLSIAGEPSARLCCRILHRTDFQNWHSANQTQWPLVDPAAPHACWLPSIDIGWLPEIPVASAGSGDNVNTAVVAYTSYNCDGTHKYRLHVVYWHTEFDPVMYTSIPLIDPNINPNLHSGCPCVDIAPNVQANKDYGYGAIAFVQQMEGDQKYEVYMVDTLNFFSGSPYHRLMQIEENDRFLPSVSLIDAGNSDSACGLVAFFENTPTMGLTMAQAKISLSSRNISSWTYATDVDVTGEWDPLLDATPIVQSDAGVSSAHVLMNPDRFWVTYCTSLDYSISNIVYGTKCTGN